MPLWSDIAEQAPGIGVYTPNVGALLKDQIRTYPNIGDINNFLLHLS